MRRPRSAAAALLVVALAALGACADGSSPASTPSTGEPTSPPAATDLSGRPVDPLAAPEALATVLLFTATDCPIANRYAPEIARIHAEYASRGVDLRLVYADPAVTAADVAQHREAFALEDVPALLDPHHALVERSGATHTPQAAVFRPDGALAYLGRIDDWYADYGQKRPAPTRRELRDALDALLAGRPVAVERAPAVGCFLPPPRGAAAVPERDS